MATHPVMPLGTLYNKPSTKAQLSYDPVYLMLRPFVILGAIFGQLPLSGLLNRNGPIGFRWCSLPEFYTLINHAASVANVVYLFNTVHMIMKSDAKNGSALDSMMVTVYMYITITVSGLSNLSVHLKAKEMLRLYRLLQHTEKQLALAASPYDLQSLPWKSKLLSPLLILFTSLISALTLAVLKFAAPPNLSFIAFSVAIVNVNFATSFPFFHGAALCWAVHLLYGRLRCVMERATERYTFSDEVDAELGRTSRITIIQVAKQGGKSTLAEIEHCRRIQQLIFSLSRQISATYTPAFLIITPCFFINCAFFMYKAWGILAGGKDTSSAVLNAIYAFNCLAPIGILGWAVDKLRSQHEKMIELVHCCRTEVLTDSTAKAMQLLALQLLQSNPQVSVADFFTVDRRFFLAMIGNLVTYLVILIQFS